MSLTTIQSIAITTPNSDSHPSRLGRLGSLGRRRGPRRGLLAAAAALTLAASLSACSGNSTDEDDNDSSASAEPTPTLTTDGATPETTDATSAAPPSEVAPAADLAVLIAGDKVTPNALELDVAPGETLKVQVTSDRAGELHVHSKPEQFLEFDEGSTSMDLVIDTPGTVEVEDHETSAVVAIITVG